MQTTAEANPVKQLRENAKRLEAALTAGTAVPSPKAVHELRSSTRRVEAQIELLGMVHGLPKYKPDAEKLLRRLSTIRRRAGRVRDCDVQTKLLKDEGRLIASSIEAPADLNQSQARLSKRLEKQRQRKEKKLLAEIERQLPKIGRDTETLLKTLKPAEDHTVPVTELLHSIDRRMERLLRSRERGEEHLHDLRKSAKRARYMCESMPGPQAAATARRLENLQDAGGSWHDFLDLAVTCHRELGAEHPLSRVLEHLRDQRLEKYLTNIEQLRETRSADNGTRRKPPQRTPEPVRQEPARRRASTGKRP